MPRLAKPKVEYLPVHESFIWEHRNMPIYESCVSDDKPAKGQFFCVSHKELLSDSEDDAHLQHASTHMLVWYCHYHKLMEEV